MKPAIIKEQDQVIGCEYPADTPRGYKMVRQTCPCLSPDEMPDNCPMCGMNTAFGVLGLA